MTVEHVPASATTSSAASGTTVQPVAVTTGGGASIVRPAADALPAPKDTAPQHVHCSGYNVWA